jgi:hypothetical protein
MKRLSLLTLSLLANGLLMLAVLVAVAQGGWRKSPGVPRDVTNRSLRISASSLPPEPAVSNAPVVVVSEPFHWAQLESSDYRVYIKNLREVGCPEATIRDMIVAEVDELFAGRVRDLVSPHVPLFWNLLADKEQFEKLIEEKAKELDQLQDDRREMLKLLLGRDGHEFVERDDEADEVAETARQQQFYEFLTPEKRARVQAIEAKYQDLIAGVYRTRLTAAEKQQRVEEFNAAKKLELAQFLTAGELSELQLRSSRHADLRYRLAGFQASEQEIKDIIAIYEKYGAARESREPNVDIRVAQRAEAQRLQDQELRALMGETRLAEFERAQDNDYQQLYRLGRTLAIPQETVAALYDQQRQAQELARRLRADRNLTPEERARGLSALRDQVDAEFRSALGQTNYSLLRRQGAAGWIDGLR